MSQTKVKSGLLNFPDQTDFVKLPSGTTAQRPSSPEKGYSRYNTTDNKLEYWNGTEWQQLPGIVPPIITSISYPGDDLAADPAGGQTITINGVDFKTGATVAVGGTTPSVISFVSATEITFTAPAKTAGDYDVVVTNIDGGNATAVDGMTYNGLPSWTTPAGNLGTFESNTTIPTITLVAAEPDSGLISYSITTGSLPSGLSLTGADIDGTTPSVSGETTYNFTVTATDNENQSTERNFNIVVYSLTVNDLNPLGDTNGIALYKLDSNANDESGNYNGTSYGSLSYAEGYFGQAGNFAGGQYIKNSSGYGIPINNNQIKTVSAWFRLEGNLSGKNTVWSSGKPNNGDCRSILQIINGYLSSSHWGSTTITPNTYQINIDTWYNIIYSGTDAYLNGSYWFSFDKALGVDDDSYGFYIGANGSYDYGYITQGIYGAPFYGKIDQVRIFNRVINSSEALSIYNES